MLRATGANDKVVKDTYDKKTTGNGATGTNTAPNAVAPEKPAETGKVTETPNGGSSNTGAGKSEEKTATTRLEEAQQEFGEDVLQDAYEEYDEEQQEKPAPRFPEEVTTPKELCEFFHYDSIDELKNAVEETHIIDFQKLENGGYTKRELRKVAKDLQEALDKIDEEEERAKREEEILSGDDLEDIKDTAFLETVQNATNVGVPKELAGYFAKEALEESLSQTRGEEISLVLDENGDYYIAKKGQEDEITEYGDREYLYSEMFSPANYTNNIEAKYKEYLRNQEPEKYALAKTMYDNPDDASRLFLEQYGNDSTKATQALQTMINSNQNNSYSGLFSNAKVKYDEEKGIIIETESYGDLTLGDFEERCKLEDIQNNNHYNENSFLNTILSGNFEAKDIDTSTALSYLTSMNSTIADDIVEGTPFAQAIKNAQTKQDAYDVITTYCGYNKEVSKAVYDYLFGESEGNDSNPYCERNVADLTEKLYTNTGNKYVLNENLLKQLTEYEVEGYDSENNPVLRPQKEYYTNLEGEICSRNWDYEEVEGHEIITVTLNENDSEKTIKFETGKNENNEQYFCIYPNGEISKDSEPIIETEEQFLKRLAIAQNYSIVEAVNPDLMSESQTMSTENIEQYYEILKTYDENIASTLLKTQTQFQKEGTIDNIRNQIVEFLDSAISDKDVLEEIKAETEHTVIMSYFLNGQDETAQELVKDELDRRLSTSDTYQDMYDILTEYGYNKDEALEIINNEAISDSAREIYPDIAFVIKDGVLFAEGKNPYTNEMQSQEAKSINVSSLFYNENPISLKNSKYSKNLSQEQAYKFLCQGGEGTKENIESYQTAQNKFTDYNTAIVSGETLAECKTPEDAFKVITGKDINDETVTDEDIKKFNRFYSIDKASWDSYVPEQNLYQYYDDPLMADYGPVRYKMSLHYDKENGFQIAYQEENDEVEYISLEGYDPNRYTLPDSLRSYTNDMLIKEINTSSGFSERLSQEKFRDFYTSEANSAQIDEYINSYADYVMTLDSNSEEYKHFEKVLKENGYGDVSKANIVDYIQSNDTNRYSESCNYMQYAYTSAKQALFGKSRLDEITGQYCTEMAQYSSKLSHALSKGCMIASVLFPAAAPVLMTGAKIAGYTDNAIDLINMISNRQNYLDDDYMGLAKSTGFEWITKKGYMMFSNIAGDSAQEATKWIIDNTKVGSFIGANALAQIGLKGASEALIETGICIPWTMAIKAVQGGEYNLKEELTENFIYDFLPYARGWQDLLIGKVDSSLYAGDGTYYRINGSDEIVQVDPDNGNRILGVYGSVDDLKNQSSPKVKYDYEDGKITVTKYTLDGKVEEITVQEKGGSKITYYAPDEAGNKGEIKKTTKSEQMADGSIKITTSEPGKPDTIEIQDNKGRTLLLQKGNASVEFDPKTSRRTSMTINGEQDVTVSYKTVFGGESVEVKVGDDNVVSYKIDKNGIANAEIEGIKISLPNEKFEQAVYSLGYQNGLDNVTALINGLGYKVSQNSSEDLVVNVGNETIPAGNLVSLSDKEVQYYDATGIPKVYNPETGETDYATLKSKGEYANDGQYVETVGLDGNKIQAPFMWGSTVIHFEGLKDCSTLDEMLKAQNVTQEEKAAIDNLYKRFEEAGEKYVQFVEERPDVFKKLLGVNTVSEGKMLSMFEEMTDGEFAAVKNAIDAYTNGEISEELSKQIWDQRMNMSVPYNFYDYIDDYDKIPDEGLYDPECGQVPKETVIEWLDGCKVIKDFLDEQSTELDMKVARFDDIDSLFKDTKIGDTTIAELMANPTEENINKVLEYFNNGDKDILYKNILGTSLGSRPISAHEGEVVFDIDVPKGSKGFFAGGAFENPNINSEREFILQAGTKLQVESATYENGVLKIKATAITPDGEKIEEDPQDTERNCGTAEADEIPKATLQESGNADKLLSGTETRTETAYDSLADERINQIREQFGDEIADLIPARNPNDINPIYDILDYIKDDVFSDVKKLISLGVNPYHAIMSTTAGYDGKAIKKYLECAENLKNNNIDDKIICDFLNCIIQKYPRNISKSIYDMDSSQLQNIIKLDSAFKRLSIVGSASDKSIETISNMTPDELSGLKEILNSIDNIDIQEDMLSSDKLEEIIGNISKYKSQGIPFKDAAIVAGANLSVEREQIVMECIGQEGVKADLAIELIQRLKVIEELNAEQFLSIYKNYYNNSNYNVHENLNLCVFAAKNNLDADILAQLVSNGKLNYEILNPEKLPINSKIYSQISSDIDKLCTAYMLNMQEKEGGLEFKNLEEADSAIKRGEVTLEDGTKVPLREGNSIKVNGKIYTIDSEGKLLEYQRISEEDVFVPKFSSESEVQKAFSEGKLKLTPEESISIKAGDVIELEGHKNACIINKDGSITELSISKQTYLKLFPPVERFATIQNGIGNCFEISTFNEAYGNNLARGQVLKLFSEDENGNIIITFPKSGRSYTFEDGKLPKDAQDDYFSRGALANRLFEYAEGMEIHNERESIIKSWLAGNHDGISYYAEELHVLVESDSQNYDVYDEATQKYYKFSDDAHFYLRGKTICASPYDDYKKMEKETSAKEGREAEEMFNSKYLQYRQGGKPYEVLKRMGFENRYYIDCTTENKSSISNPRLFLENIVILATIPKGDKPESLIDGTRGLYSQHANGLRPTKVIIDGKLEIDLDNMSLEDVCKCYKEHDIQVSAFAFNNPHNIVEAEMTYDELIEYGNYISCARIPGIYSASYSNSASGTKITETGETDEVTTLSKTSTEPEKSEEETVLESPADYSDTNTRENGSFWDTIKRGISDIFTKPVVEELPENLDETQYDKGIVKGLSPDEAKLVASAGLDEAQEKIFNELYENRSFLNNISVEDLVKISKQNGADLMRAIEITSSAKAYETSVSLMADIYNDFNDDERDKVLTLLIDCNTVNIEQIHKLIEFDNQRPDNLKGIPLGEIARKIVKYNTNPTAGATLAKLKLDDTTEERLYNLCKQYRLPIDDNSVELARHNDFTPEQDKTIIELRQKNNLKIKEAIELETSNITDSQKEQALQYHTKGIPITKAIEIAKNPANYEEYLASFSDLRELKDSFGEPIFGKRIYSADNAKYLTESGEDILEIEGKYYLINSPSVDYFATKGYNSEILIDMVQQGALDKKVLESLPASGEISEYVKGDLDKIATAYYSNTPIEDVFVPKVSESDIALGKIKFGDEEISLKTGDIVELEGHKNPCIINPNGSTTELNISKETYLKLFPPIEKFATIQNEIGNCHELSAFNSVFRDPSTRHYILDMFKEDEQGNITITYPNSGRSYTFENGKLPDDTVMRYFSKGALAVQMLEWADGREIQAERRDKFLENLTEQSKQMYLKQGLLEEKKGEITFVDDAYVNANGSLYKYNGSHGQLYEESRHGGLSSDSFKRFGMQGTAHYIVDSSTGWEGLDSNLRSNLANAEFLENNIVVIGTIPKEGSSAESNLNSEEGIISSHAYQLIAGKTAPDGTVETYKILNPHGMVEVEITPDELKQYTGNIEIASKFAEETETTKYYEDTDTQNTATYEQNKETIVDLKSPEIKKIISDLKADEKTYLDDNTTIQKDKNGNILISQKENGKIVKVNYYDTNDNVQIIDVQKLPPNAKIDYTDDGIIIREYAGENITSVKYVSESGEYTTIDIDNLVQRRIEKYRNELIKLEGKEDFPKHPLTDDEILKATRISSEFYVEYLLHEKEMSDIAKGLFEDVESIETISSRAKSENSIYTKLTKFIQKGELNIDDTIACKEVIADAYGSRIQVSNLTEEQHREVVESYLKEFSIDCTYEDYLKLIEGTADERIQKQLEDVRQKEILRALKEKQTDLVVDKIVENMTSDPPKITIADGKISNYGSEESTYFTPKQLERIADAYFKQTGKKLKIISIKEEGYNDNAVWTVKKSEDGDYDFCEAETFTVESKDAFKDSGYTTSQFKTIFNFADGTTGYGEIQIRGIEVNKYGDIEHIPYDYKKHKLDETDPRYAQVCRCLGSMDDESFKNYTAQMAEIYKASHKIELGYPNAGIPKLKGIFRDKQGNILDISCLSYDSLMKQFGHK